MAATIKDIAKRLNISVSTVSYALNGGPRPVPEEVREKVLATAADLGYRPNRLAKSMVTGKSMTLGVVPDRPDHDIMLSPYVQGIVNAVMNVAEDTDNDILLFTRANPNKSKETLGLLLDGRVDGLVFMSNPGYQEIFPELDRAGLPYVVVSLQAENAPAFSVDNHEGIRLAVEHLIDLGHSRFGFIAGLAEHKDAIERKEAFQWLCQKHDLVTSPEWVGHGDFHKDGGRKEMERILSLKDRPSAIIASNDDMAYGATLAAKAMGVRIPEDVSLVGFDGADVSEVSDPPLTTVCQPISQIGRAAAEILVKRIKGDLDQDSITSSTKFSPLLVVRSSTGHFNEDKTP